MVTLGIHQLLLASRHSNFNYFSCNALHNHTSRNTGARHATAGGRRARVRKCCQNVVLDNLKEGVVAPDLYEPGRYDWSCAGGRVAWHPDLINGKHLARSPWPLQTVSTAAKTCAMSSRRVLTNGRWS